MTLDKADIQGNLLRGYGFRRVAHLFFAIERPAQARAFLRRLEVTSALRWPEGKRPSHALNVAFSSRGLTCLAQARGEFDQALLAAMLERYPAFAEGMQARAAQLGDDLACAGVHPDWSRVDLWVAVFADDQTELHARVQSLTRAAGIELLFGGPLCGNALERGTTRIEHFGFRDDMSNPALEGAAEPDDRPRYNLGNGKLEDGVAKPLRAGEFVLGYANESGDAVADDALGRFVRNGTFAVFRDLKQNVGVFRSYVEQTAAALQRDPLQIAALIIGRQQDGEPLIEPARGDDTGNDFGYREDRDGARCPFASHVRRTHPRDASGIPEVSHRLLRRGMPYGPLLPEGAAEDGIPRGLYFVAYNASIERQFEFVQQRWVNAPTGTGLEDDFDPLLCRRSASMVIPAAGEGGLPRVIDGLGGFVDFLGGGYFFVPGRSALRTLAAEVTS